MPSVSPKRQPFLTIPWRGSFRISAHSEHEEREIIVGQSLANRLLIVSLVERMPERIRIISAREATKMEQLDYEEAT